MNIKRPKGDYEYTTEDIETVEVLLKHLGKRTGTISYAELSKEVSTHPNPHFGFNTPLLKIGFLCNQLGLPFITCCVVTANYKLQEGNTTSIQGIWNRFKGLDSCLPNCHVVLHSKVGETVDELRKRSHESDS